MGKGDGAVQGDGTGELAADGPDARHLPHHHRPVLSLAVSRELPEDAHLLRLQKTTL